jgi:hypothetical protein
MRPGPNPLIRILTSICVFGKFLCRLLVTN